VCNGNLAVFTKVAPLQVRGPKTTFAAVDTTTAASNVHSIAAGKQTAKASNANILWQKTQAGFEIC